MLKLGDKIDNVRKTLAILTMLLAEYSVLQKVFFVIYTKENFTATPHNRLF